MEEMQSLKKLKDYVETKIIQLLRFCDTVRAHIVTSNIIGDYPLLLSSLPSSSLSLSLFSLCYSHYIHLFLSLSLSFCYFLCVSFFLFVSPLSLSLSLSVYTFHLNLKKSLTCSDRRESLFVLTVRKFVALLYEFPGIILTVHCI